MKTDRLGVSEVFTRNYSSVGTDNSFFFIIIQTIIYEMSHYICTYTPMYSHILIKTVAV